jgi:hypothetical protein
METHPQIRHEVRELAAAGPFPDEQDATVEEIDEVERLIDLIDRPVTDDEAQLLATLFGPDNCYGLAWTLLHLIETAPGAQIASYRQNPDNEWVIRLNARVDFARALDAQAEPG